MAIKKTILIVDDQADASELLRDLLQLEDAYRIFTVGSGADAYAKVKNASIDLIVTDYNMPKMSGAELYNLVRSSKLNANIPVLFVSGAIEKVVEEIKREPLIEFLAKPIRSNVLLETVKGLLSKSEQMQTKGYTPVTKPQVDVSIMNHFITATISTLSNMVDIKNITNEPMKNIDRSQEQSPGVSGMININCQKFNGSLIVSIPEQTILNIHNKLLGETKSGVDEEVAATVGEIVNIIWGRTKKLIEAENLAFTNSLPIVFQDTKKFFGNETRCLTLTVPFKTELGSLHILFTISF